MRGRNCLVIALGGLLLASLKPVFGFVANLRETGDPIRWNFRAPVNVVATNVFNRSTSSIRYFIAGDAYSQTNRTAEINAVRAAFAQWQLIPGSAIRFEEGGLMPGEVDVAPLDGTNVVFWKKGSTLVYGGMADISRNSGVTFTSFLEDGTLRGADIVLNGAQFQWFTDFNTPPNSQTHYFAESVLGHEIGHLIGLDHSPLGGATMLAQGLYGLTAQAGLSTDEMAAARALYPLTEFAATRGTLKGTVSMGGKGIFGAVVTAEDEHGNIVAGTITRTNTPKTALGAYELPALPPGNYQVRVSPLDAHNGGFWLVRGREISVVRTANEQYYYDGVETRFLPTPGESAGVLAGKTTTLNLTVTNRVPAYRISHILKPVSNLDVVSAVQVGVTARPGESNLYFGVLGLGFPAQGSTLKVTGDGVTILETVFRPRAINISGVIGLDLLAVKLRIDEDAAPGLRSFIFQQGTNVAVANGFLKILPRVPDYNFDGLDDRFQRAYFPLFTALEAGPENDADQDGFDNQAEYIAGSSPIDPASFLKIESARLEASGTIISWRSAPGRQYQVLSRPTAEGGTWSPLGAPVIADGVTTQFRDASATNEIGFYRVQAIP